MSEEQVLKAINDVLDQRLSKLFQQPQQVISQPQVIPQVASANSVIPVPLQDYIALTVKAQSTTPPQTEDFLKPIMPLLTLKMIGGIA